MILNQGSESIKPHADKHAIGGTDTITPESIGAATAPFKPAGKSYLTFNSPNSFTLKVNDTTKHWDGTLEYFASNKIWTTWDGTTTLSSINNDGEYVLYLRGTGNTKLSYYDESTSTYIPWTINGTGVHCNGNIETLLDYATVELGQHPVMADECFDGLFMGCTALITPPDLPAITLAYQCYYKMFADCTSLIKAPALPATTLTDFCYEYMFKGCTALTQAPVLPATTLVRYCYDSMFYGCTSLTQAPALPATTLASSCYEKMFWGCTSLTQAPALPATTLTDFCYYGMFRGCTSLTQAPALPATTLVMYCYYRMFQNCTALTKAPALPATTLADYCYEYMFHNCTSLTQAPALPATTLETHCYNCMFTGCTALTQAPTLPATTLADGCYFHMFSGCTSLKLSSIQTNEYTQEYRIPMTETGTTATNALTNMFTNTGGTFTETPEINTTYYLSSDNMVVRETEIATLNGYVESMIDAVTPESIGAAAATHASQHARGGSDPITLDSIAFLGTNPISSTTDDTTTNWKNLGSGFAWYNATGKLNGQPSQYGHLVSYSQREDIFQIWNTQAGGPTYFRSGNGAGWNGGWRKVYDTSNKPTPTDIGAAASNHNHSVSNITSGTLSAARGGTGQTTLTPDAGTKGVRQIYAGTSDMTAGSTSLTTGVVYFVYE